MRPPGGLARGGRLILADSSRQQYPVSVSHVEQPIADFPPTHLFELYLGICAARVPRASGRTHRRLPGPPRPEPCAAPPPGGSSLAVALRIAVLCNTSTRRVSAAFVSESAAVH